MLYAPGAEPPLLCGGRFRVSGELNPRPARFREGWIWLPIPLPPAVRLPGTNQSAATEFVRAETSRLSAAPSGVSPPLFPSHTHLREQRPALGERTDFS